MPKTSAAADGALRRLPAAAIVASAADAAARWCDADFPPRVRASAAVEARLGYTSPVVEYALDRLFGGITRGALTSAIADELGSLEALDGFVERAGRPRAWARGAGRVTIVASDTTVGVALAPLVFALCAKCTVTVKDRSDALIAAFAASLSEERAEFGTAVDARAWTGGEAAVEAETLGSADVVVAFGAADALRAIRARCAPDATFVPYGHRASCGYLTRAALASGDGALASRIARDALLYDGDGCLSLHLLFAERSTDGALDRFVPLLADACARIAVAFPPPLRPPGRAARVTSIAAAAAFRAANGRGAVLRAPDGAWTIVLDPPRDELPPFGGGVIPVVPVDDAEDAAAYAAHHRLPLQALGVAVVDDAAAWCAERLGAVRVTAFGTMQDPPLAGRHGGRPRIADFVRWIERT